MRLPVRRLTVDPVTGDVFGPYGRKLKPDLTNCGYLRVCTCNRPFRRESIHRLVWEAVHGPIAPGVQINHLNGVKTDNRIENLAATTPSENICHGHRTGLYPRGSQRVQSKLTESQVEECKSLRAKGWSYPRLAARYGVSHPTIQALIKGLTWKHVKEVQPSLS